MDKYVSTAFVRAAFEKAWGHGLMRISLCAGSPSCLSCALEPGRNMIALSPVIPAKDFIVNKTAAAETVENKGMGFQVPAQNNVPVSATGIIDHVSLITTGATGLIYFTTPCNPLIVAELLNRVNVSAFSVNMGSAV